MTQQDNKAGLTSSKAEDPEEETSASATKDSEEKTSASATEETGEVETKEALPSLFFSLRSTSSKPLQNVLTLEHYIRFDKMTKITTEKYREAKAIDRKLAYNAKRNSIAICPSIQFKPNGRTLNDFGKETLWLMLDYDHVVSATLDEKVRLASRSKYAMVVYRTISGMGLRILIRYMRPLGCTLTATELHRLAITKAMRLFDSQLSLVADRQCLDMQRLCGLAHDENAYFNWNADRLEITPEEITYFFKKEVQPTLEADTPTSHSPKTSTRTKAKISARPAITDIDKITKQVKLMSEHWDIKFKPGSHYNFLMRFTTFCHNYGANHDELLRWLNDKYGSEYEDIEAIVKCIYKHTESFGSWHLYEPGEGFGKNPGVKAIKQWLSHKFEFRHNIITGKFELRSLDILFSKYYKWTDIDDIIENSLYTKMNTEGLRVPQSMLHAVIKSDFCEDFNPLHNYLNGLVGKWKKEDGKDYIGEVAAMVCVKEDKENFHSQQDFEYAFRKWFVAMVAGWSSDKVVNHTILLLVGRGGIFKTTYLEHLIPPELAKYFANDSTADYSNKDFQELAASKALVCLDEFEAPHGKNLSAFKSIITKPELTYRRPYDHYPSTLRHNTTFCATSNKIHFLDEEENRRYLIWEVDYIDNPLKKKIDYSQLYAQAVTLYKEVLDREEKEGNENAVDEKKATDDSKGDSWVYWLTAEDRKKQEIHNRLFMVNNYLEELIRRFYRLPTEQDENNCNLKFVTNADILDRICTNPVFRQEFAKKDIMQAMAKLGFKRKHRRDKDGYWVVERDGRDMAIESGFILGEDKL